MPSAGARRKGPQDPELLVLQYLQCIQSIYRSLSCVCKFLVFYVFGSKSVRESGEGVGVGMNEPRKASSIEGRGTTFSTPSPLTRPRKIHFCCESHLDRNRQIHFLYCLEQKLESQKPVLQILVTQPQLLILFLELLELDLKLHYLSNNNIKYVCYSYMHFRISPEFTPNFGSAGSCQHNLVSSHLLVILDSQSHIC